MKRIIAVYTGVLCLALLGGCASPNRTPLLFGQTQTVGLSVSSGAADQGAEFTLGYRDKNIAVMPVLMCKEEVYERSEGNRDTYCAERPRLATARGDNFTKTTDRITDDADEGVTENGSDDAFSVLGQFQLESETSAEVEGTGGKPSLSADVGLGKFFATGLAARELAKGFAKALEEKAKK